jgi:FRG domain
VGDWNKFLTDVHAHIDDLAESGCDMPFFRGHADGRWKLLCGLGRQPLSEFKKKNIESVLYYDFLSLGGGLLGRHADSWDALFAMQHHGLPTRLLDWSTTFSAALYFSLRPYLHIRNFPEISTIPLSPCIWILDPFELNRIGQQDPAVANPYTDFDGTYQENFIEESKSIDSKAVAISPSQVTRRQAAQRSVFTLHADLFTPLEQFANGAVRKFPVPPDAIQDGLRFLTLAGMNEFSVFPDLDGLARYLKAEHVSWL